MIVVNGQGLHKKLKELHNIMLRTHTNNIFFFSTFLFLAFLLCIPFYTSAQLVQNLENTIVVRINPTNPGPEELVTIFAESFSIDLDTSTVSWFVNDVLEGQSIGMTSFQFVTGDLGSINTIDIVAQTREGVLETERIIITPTDIDILLQANTFAHPLYNGKRIASVGSLIHLEVVPHFVNSGGERLNAQELIYSWSAENKALPRASGRGKHAIIVSQTKPVGSLFIEVEVRSADNTLFGKKGVTIPIRDSELFVYENNPLLGILFNTAIRGIYSLTSKETKFIAYPFFMSFTDRNASHITYLWKLNNTPIVLGDDRGSITVSHTGRERGEAEISVSVENSQEIFQRNNARFNIEFGRDFSSGF